MSLHRVLITIAKRSLLSISETPPEQKMDNDKKEIRRLKCSAFDMLEEIVKLREENANLKKHVIDIENKHKEEVAVAVGNVAVRYEKDRKEMFKKVRFYRGEMIKASNSLQRLRSFCRNLPNDMRLKIVDIYKNTPIEIDNDTVSEDFAKRVSEAAKRLRKNIEEQTRKRKSGE